MGFDFFIAIIISSLLNLLGMNLLFILLLFWIVLGLTEID